MSFLSTSHPAGSKRRHYKICATCLSLGSDDHLHPLSEELTIILKNLLYDFDLDGCLKLAPPENGLKLCRLCLKTLRDIYVFKQKALKSLNCLKKQREICLQRNQTEQKTSQSLPEDEIVVTSKDELKEEPDPLEMPKIFLVSHSTRENIKSVNIKEESHIDNDDDHTNAESNLDTDLTDSVHLDDDIKKSCILKKRDTKGQKQNSTNSENKRKFRITTVRRLVSIAPKPDPSFGKTTDSSYMAVENQPLASLNVGPSALPVATSQPQVGSNTSAKEQNDTQISNDTPCSDTESESGAEEWRGKEQPKKPWYIKPLTREQLVKFREDTLKDPNFAKATYKCTYCAMTFIYKDQWDRHKGHCYERSMENAEFSCFVCGLSFDTLPLLSLHQRFHGLGHHTYQCSTCDFTSNELHLTRHRCPNKGGEQVPPKDPTMKLVLGGRQYYCPACDYVSFNAVIPHYNSHHTTVPVTCDVCGTSLKHLAALQHHKKKEHSGKPPPEKKEYMFCAPCVKSFYSKATYQAHMMTAKHAPKDQLSISCDECPRKFHLQELYERHKRSHEIVRSGTKPHKCPHCGSSYVFKSTLRAHIRTKHTKHEVKRDHVCEMCGAAFKIYSILRKHMAKHSDERPFKCEYCGDTFKYSGARYTHIKLKHKKKKTKPDYDNKGTSKSARNRKWRMEKIDEHEQRMGTEEHIKITETHEHEQSMESHEEEQSMETSVSKGDVGSEDYDKNLEMQSIAESMEV